MGKRQWKTFEVGTVVTGVLGKPKWGYKAKDDEEYRYARVTTDMIYERVGGSLGAYAHRQKLRIFTEQLVVIEYLKGYVGCGVELICTGTSGTGNKAGKFNTWGVTNVWQLDTEGSGEALT